VANELQAQLTLLFTLALRCVMLSGPARTVFQWLVTNLMSERLSVNDHGYTLPGVLISIEIIPAMVLKGKSGLAFSFEDEYIFVCISIQNNISQSVCVGGGGFAHT